MSDDTHENDRFFGDHTIALATILHLSLKLSDLEDGQFKDGFAMAIEEAGAWLDGEAGDGGDQMQTLCEQVVGLVLGNYSLVQTSKVERLHK